MKLKNLELYCELVTYSSRVDEVISQLHKVGVSDIRVEYDYKLMFKASLKQLNKLGYLDNRDRDVRIKIDLQH